jgi:hypothetical protein
MVSNVAFALRSIMRKNLSHDFKVTLYSCIMQLCKLLFTFV